MGRTATIPLSHARRSATTGLVASLAIVVGSTIHAQSPPSIDSVRAHVRHLISTGVLPSVAIAAAKDGRIVWEEAFGFADRERHTPATTETMYSLASVSKPITATGLMVLVQRGRVDLDRPINDYLGSPGVRAFEGKASDATVRRVANHTAGLPLHYQFFYQGGAYDRPPMEQSIARYAILVTPPGTTFTYSNLGFGLLERVIERVAGQSYEAFMRREVFAPLGLTRTAVLTKPVTGDTVAVRYDQSGRPIPWYDFDHRGASAIYSSAHDLAEFGLFELGHPPGAGSVLSRRSLEALHQPTARRAETVGYGVGWATYEDDVAPPSLGHGGGMPGVATSLRIYPAADMVVVVLANAANNTAVSAIARMVARSISGDESADEAASPPPSTASFDPPQELLGEWAGSIRTWQAEMPVRLSVAADSVAMALGDQPMTAVGRPRWDGERLTGAFPGSIPTPDASRAATRIVLDLHLVGGHLGGGISAVAGDGFALSSYARLERVAR